MILLLLDNKTLYAQVKNETHVSSIVYSEVNLQNPSVIDAKTDYFGTRVSLFFDMPLSSNTEALENITIYEDSDGSLG